MHVDDIVIKEITVLVALKRCRCKICGIESTLTPLELQQAEQYLSFFTSQKDAIADAAMVSNLETWAEGWVDWDNCGCKKGT